MTHSPRDTVRRRSYSQKWVLSPLHPAPPLGILWSRVGMERLVGLCPPQRNWHQGAGGDYHTKERACLLKNDPNSEVLVAQRQ